MRHENKEEPKTRTAASGASKPQPITGTLTPVFAEDENPSVKPHRTRHASAAKISAVFLVPGILSLIFSIYKDSQVLAFIGLGLTFWGALFLLIKPSTYVKGNVLDASLTSTYTTVDRIISDMKIKGRSYYIPPYPKDVYLPAHLKGLKETLVFISANMQDSFPALEELARSKFITQNPKGICISPPGLGLVAQIEKELKTDPARIDLDTLCETLPQTILENFQLATEMEMKHDKNEIQLRIQNNIYANLYTMENLKSPSIIGCPLVSATACLIAKTTGKTVTIQTIRPSPEAHTVAIIYQTQET
jgi:hypothetical protein